MADDDKQFVDPEEERRKRIKKMKEDAVQDVEITDELIKDLNLNTNDIQSLLGLEEAYMKSNYAIKHDVMDSMMYDDMKFHSPALQRLVNAGHSHLENFEYLNEDEYLALFKERPKLMKESAMTPGSFINQRLLKEIVKTEEFSKLRRLCKGNSLNASIGTQTLTQRTIELFDKWKQEYEAAQQQGKSTANTPGEFLLQGHQAQQQQKQALQQYQQAKTLNNLAKTTIVPGMKQLYQQQAQTAIKAAQSAFNQAKAASILANQNQAFNNMTYDLRTTVQDAFLQTQEADDFISNWGLDGSGMGGVGTRITIEAKRKALERIRGSEKLKRLTDIIGKMKSMAMTDFKKKTKEEKVEIDDIKTGNDLAHILPSELINLCIPGMEALFYKGFTEGTLLEYDKVSEETQAKGPIIACLDESGSMDDYGSTVSKEVYSKGLIGGILEMAQLQKRDFICIKFADKLGKIHEFPKDEFDTTKFLDMMEQFINGGTNFRPPLEKALELIKTSRYKEADIVFITDGEARLDPTFLSTFNKIKEEKEFSCFGLVLDNGVNSRETMNNFCDKVISLSNIISDGDKVGHEIFSAL